MPRSLRLDIKSLGFYVQRGRPGTMSEPHAHTDIEGNFLLSGTMTYLHGGRHYTLGPGRLAVFWAGIPHRLIDVTPDAQTFWLVLPLAWYMQWQLPESVTQRLLGGEIVLAPDASTALDPLQLSQWRDDLARPDADIRRIVMLEIEARFRRFARELDAASAQEPAADDATGSHTERLAAYMAQHYREALDVTAIAGHVGLHPNYAMQLFKKRCGMGMWEYLVRLRISHAQRLLLTTSWKINRIAAESGFASPSRFYEAFTKISGCRPGEYRAGSRLAELS